MARGLAAPREIPRLRSSLLGSGVGFQRGDRSVSHGRQNHPELGETFGRHRLAACHQGHRQGQLQGFSQGGFAGAVASGDDDEPWARRQWQRDLGADSAEALDADGPEVGADGLSGSFIRCGQRVDEFR